MLSSRSEVYDDVADLYDDVVVVIVALGRRDVILGARRS